MIVALSRNGPRSRALGELARLGVPAVLGRFAHCLLGEFAARVVALALGVEALAAGGERWRS